MTFLTPGVAGVGAVVGITATALLGLVVLAARVIANRPPSSRQADFNEIDRYAAYKVDALQQQIQRRRLARNLDRVLFGLLSIAEVFLLFLGKLSTDPKVLGLAVVMVAFAIRGQFALIEKAKHIERELSEDVRVSLQAEEQLVLARTAADRQQRMFEVVHLINSRLG